MWVIAGVLLGLVVLASLIGFHAGPHAHAAAGVLGVAAAVWLIVMAANGRSAPILWALLTADVVVSGGVVTAAWKGLSGRHVETSHLGVTALESAEGVALDTLDPHGLVRVRGETWSATSMNGTIPKGTAIQVIRVDGVRLAVWGEESVPKEIHS
jgi:membrane-bound ClpP family serine protease